MQMIASETQVAAPAPNTMPIVFAAGIACTSDNPTELTPTVEPTRVKGKSKSQYSP
jgi:hypothetical protein